MEFGKFFSPMLLNEVEEPFDSSKFLFEMKFDGIRATIHVGINTFKIFGRREHEITELYPELKEIQKEFTRNVILDGEIVLFYNGVPSFSKLQERSHTKDKKKIKYFSENLPVCFMAFDCLYEDKQDLTKKPLIERKKVLQKYPDTNFLIKVSYIKKEGKKLFRKIGKMDFEGIVAKRMDSMYEIGTRSDAWIKIKNLKKEIFTIGGYIDKKENAVVSLLLGEYQNQEFHFVGKVTMGKKQALYPQLKKEQIKKSSPFYDYEDQECCYVTPHLKCEVWYLERTSSNHLRQPIFKK